MDANGKMSVTEKIDFELESLQREVVWAEDACSEWSTMGQSLRDDASVQWDDVVVGLLPWLINQRDSGLMTSDQRNRFVALEEVVGRSWPSLSKLGFARPEGIVLETRQLAHAT